MLRGLNHRKAVLQLFSLYCASSGRGPARVSTLIWNHGARHHQILCGADLRTRSFERAIAWFSDHWPEDLPWPPGVPRPGTAEPISGCDQSLREAMALSESGRLRSPSALCKALRIRRTTYDYVIRRYADGADRADAFPQRGTWTRRLFDCLVASGDARFATRRARLEKAADTARRLLPVQSPPPDTERSPKGRQSHAD